MTGQLEYEAIRSAHWAPVVLFGVAAAMARQPDDERAALSDPAVHDDLSAVGLRNCMNNREAKAGAAFGASARFVGAVETLEDVRKILVARRRRGCGCGSSRRSGSHARWL